jgi:hypothetical protein
MMIPLFGSPAFADSRRIALGDPMKRWHRRIGRAYRDDAGESHDQSTESRRLSNRDEVTFHARATSDALRSQTHAAAPPAKAQKRP